MKKQSVSLFRITFIMALVVIAVTAGTLVTTTAYADAIVDLNNVQIDVQPMDVSFVYGNKTDKLTVKLNQEGINCRYVWYMSNALDGVYTEVKNGNGQIIDYPITSREDNGYYYCKIVEVSYGNSLKEVNIISDKAYVYVEPKLVTVKPSNKLYVYDGTWQNYNATIEKTEIINGDTVNVIGICDKATKDAGTYQIELKLDNPNYAIKGDTVVPMVINRALVKIKPKDIVILKGQEEIDYEIIYNGFADGEDVEKLDLGVELKTNTFSKYDYGVYQIYATGKEKTDNYNFIYEPARLYVNREKANVTAGEDLVDGVIGSFYSNSSCTIEKTEFNASALGFHFLKPIDDAYLVSFDKEVASDTYTVNIKSENLSKFCLAVCCIENGKVKKVENYNYHEGILSVKVGVETKNAIIVVYREYTLITAIGALLIMALLVTFFVILSDRSKYRRKKQWRDAAIREANYYRRIERNRRR